MSRHDPLVRVHHMLDHAREAVEMVRNRSRTDLDTDRITLDSYIISATRYEDLYRKYDNGTWDKKRFADAHILFQERSPEYDYIEQLFQGQLTPR